MKRVEIDPKFSEAMSGFYVGCVKIYNDHCVKSGFTITDTFRLDEGNRYFKVIRGSSVHCFVDKTNGDVLKPASWKVPAKHARGNILDANNGLRYMGEYGPAYLR
jgi:hypothetical protein